MSTSLLEQRRIEAQVIAPLFHAFAQEIGRERAVQILLSVIRDLARQSGCDAAQSVGGTTLRDFAQATERWRANGSLELTVLRQDDEAFEFNVTRCRYAEMYRDLGLSELGGVLSCARDAAMVEGFNSRIEFSRTQTLLAGQSHCDFRFRLAKPACE